jgi:hypothetical protein
MGDFNSTEPTSMFDVVEVNPPSGFKERNAEFIQDLLNESRFKNLWTMGTNEAQERERPKKIYSDHPLPPRLRPQRVKNTGTRVN